MRVHPRHCAKSCRIHVVRLPVSVFALFRLIIDKGVLDIRNKEHIHIRLCIPHRKASQAQSRASSVNKPTRLNLMSRQPTCRERTQNFGFDGLLSLGLLGSGPPLPSLPLPLCFPLGTATHREEPGQIIWPMSSPGASVAIGKQS